MTMILYKYYIVYVERVTGYPGVEEVHFQSNNLETIKLYLERNRAYAVLKILEAN